MIRKSSLRTGRRAPGICTDQAGGSMEEKCQRNLPRVPESALKEIRDAVGLDVCSFIEDIYQTIEVIRQLEDCEIVLEKDYIIMGIAPTTRYWGGIPYEDCHGQKSRPLFGQKSASNHCYGFLNNRASDENKHEIKDSLNGLSASWNVQMSWLLVSVTMQTIRNLIRRKWVRWWKILLAEDEQQLSRVLETAMTHEGYQGWYSLWWAEAVDLAEGNAYVWWFWISWCRWALKHWKKSINQQYDPSSCWQLCQRWMTRSQGLDAGADDYLTQPFSERASGSPALYVRRVTTFTNLLQIGQTGLNVRRAWAH